MNTSKAISLLGALLIVAAPIAVSGNLGKSGTDAGAEANGVAEWWGTLSGGGILNVETPAFEVGIPMTVSSVLASDVEDAPPGTAEKIVVLRGFTEDAAAAVVLKKDVVGMIVNGPDGRSYTMRIPETPPVDVDVTRVLSDEESERYGPATPLGDFRGPIRVTEFTETVDVPDALATTDAHEHEEASEGPVEARFVHLAPQDGNSIRLSKHIWSSSEPTGPSNIIFYDMGTAGWVDTTLKNAAWKTTSCGSSKNMYFFDYRHGGSNQWQSQNRHYKFEDSSWCGSARYHLRAFVSETGDTHTPGFSKYTGAEAHWEDTWHTDVYPQKGQDKVLSHMLDSHDVENIWLVKLDYSDDECKWCKNWNGWVDIYQIWELRNQDPCGSSTPDHTIYGGNVLTVRWTCHG